jgi:hypothetical protein
MNPYLGANSQAEGDSSVAPEFRQVLLAKPRLCYKTLLPAGIELVYLQRKRSE